MLQTIHSYGVVRARNINHKQLFILDNLGSVVIIIDVNNARKIIEENEEEKDESLDMLK